MFTTCTCLPPQTCALSSLTVPLSEEESVATGCLCVLVPFPPLSSRRSEDDKYYLKKEYSFLPSSLCGHLPFLTKHPRKPFSQREFSFTYLPYLLPSFYFLSRQHITSSQNHSHTLNCDSQVYLLPKELDEQVAKIAFNLCLRSASKNELRSRL